MCAAHRTKPSSPHSFVAPTTLYHMPNTRCVHKDESDFQCVSFVEHRLLRMCQYHANLALPKLAATKQIPQSPLTTADAPPASNLSKRHGVVVSNWRTTMCDNFTSTGKCPYGYTCAFAHGASKLRNPGDPFPKVVYVPKSGVGEIAPDASDDDGEDEEKQNQLPAVKRQTLFAAGSPFLYFVPKKPPICTPLIPPSLPKPPSVPPRPPSTEEEYDLIASEDASEEEEYTCPKIVDKDMLRDLRILRKIQLNARRPTPPW